MVGTLDLIDLKLLRSLDANARASYASIGKEASISKERARYRIRSYEHTGLLVKSYALIDHSLLSLQLYKVFLKLQHTTSAIEKELSDFLTQEISLVSSSRCEGDFEMVFLALCKHPKEVYDFFVRLKKRFGNVLLRKEIHQVAYLHRNIFDDDTRSLTLIGSKAPDLQSLTPVRMKILQELTNDARVSSVALARKLSRSAKNVAQNISFLSKNGFIRGFGIHLNPAHMGWMKVILNINLQDPSSSAKIVGFFQMRRMLRFSHHLIGRYDLSLELWFEDFDEYKRIMLEFKDNFSDKYSYYDVLNVYEEIFRGFSILKEKN